MQNTGGACHLDTGRGYSIPGGADMPPKHPHTLCNLLVLRSAAPCPWPTEQAPHPAPAPGQRRSQPATTSTQQTVSRFM